VGRIAEKEENWAQVAQADKYKGMCGASQSSYPKDLEKNSGQTGAEKKKAGQVHAKKKRRLSIKRVLQGRGEKPNREFKRQPVSCGKRVLAKKKKGGNGR